ncbi:aminotransferase class IV [Colwellia sp. RSH04]|uniref:aminotransferase class IV n=1 Tax=Colwellia sp. RSH04 TaxID=2305464 RepID=UPI000E581D83|nr:aminotransferase class IV [Colwellia sp. RSH04]RHW76503.1 D-alanine aminotransferase [Colwellia sp. RSH04]
MNTVFLNGEYLPADKALISPMDRGFLFGEGIYEVIPSYSGQFIGLAPHLNRLNDGLKALKIKTSFTLKDWLDICNQLIEKNDGENLALYIQVTRGCSLQRHHAYNNDLTPTIYAFTFGIPNAPLADKSQVKTYKVSTDQDLRWQRCNIKSTSLLGNVMHFQKSVEESTQETILFNSKNELTEASASNVFIVKNKVIITPHLDHQILPGVTRFILLDILKKYCEYAVEERVVSYDEVINADEVWLTSSTKEVAPVVAIANKEVGSGRVGELWLAAQTLFSQYKGHYE